MVDKPKDMPEDQWDRNFHYGIAQRYEEVGADPRIEHKQYRLTFYCPSCEEEHLHRGTVVECLSSLNCLMLMGITGAMIADEGCATEADLVTAEENLAEHAPTFNSQFNEHLAAILKRGPKTRD